MKKLSSPFSTDYFGDQFPEEDEEDYQPPKKVKRKYKKRKKDRDDEDPDEPKKPAKPARRGRIPNNMRETFAINPLAGVAGKSSGVLVVSPELRELLLWLNDLPPCYNQGDPPLPPDFDVLRGKTFDYYGFHSALGKE